jgi:hypothetical protein
MKYLFSNARKRRTRRRNELAFARAGADQHRQRLYSIVDNVIYVDFATNQ